MVTKLEASWDVLALKSNDEDRDVEGDVTETGATAVCCCCCCVLLLLGLVLAVGVVIAGVVVVADVGSTTPITSWCKG
jgi:hypothetical protein